MSKLPKNVFFLGRATKSKSSQYTVALFSMDPISIFGVEISLSMGLEKRNDLTYLYLLVILPLIHMTFIYFLVGPFSTEIIMVLGMCAQYLQSEKLCYEPKFSLDSWSKKSKGPVEDCCYCCCSAYSVACTTPNQQGIHLRLEHHFFHSSQNSHVTSFDFAKKYSSTKPFSVIFPVIFLK